MKSLKDIDNSDEYRSYCQKYIKHQIPNTKYFTFYS